MARRTTRDATRGSRGRTRRALRAFRGGGTVGSRPYPSASRRAGGARARAPGVARQPPRGAPSWSASSSRRIPRSRVRSPKEPATIRKKRKIQKIRKTRTAALRQSVEHLNAEMARVRSTTAAKVRALVDAKEKAERDLHAVTKRACAAERAEREAVAASETLRGETNRLDADLVNAQKRLASAEVALVDERRRAAEVAAELESTRRRHESESRRTNAELEFLSENFPDAAGDLADAEAEIERLNDELRALRDELASVNAAREDAARSAAESIEAAKSEAADAVVAADAKEKELWARDGQLEKRARDANAAAKAPPSASPR